MAARELTKKDAETAKKAFKEAATEKSRLTDEQAEIANQILKEASMPVGLTDEEFELGPRELDIRGLNAKNKAQMAFRMQVLQNVYLRQIAQNQIDIMRLMFVLLDKLGVEDIDAAVDAILDKSRKQVAKNAAEAAKREAGA